MSLGRVAFSVVTCISSSIRSGGTTSSEICLYVGFVVSQMAYYLIFLTTASMDNNPDASPILRRASYLTLAVITVTDAITSAVLAPFDATFVMIGSFRAQPFQNISSATSTQAVIAIYLSTLCWRSSTGKAWGHRGIRFVLDLQLSESFAVRDISAIEQSGVSLPLTQKTDNDAEKLAGNGEEIEGRRRISIIQRGSIVLKRGLNFAARLKQLLLNLQQKLRNRCVTMAIPCHMVSSDHQGKATDFELQRPLFELRFMRKIQRLALKHTFKYSCFLVGSLVLSLGVYAVGDTPLTLRQDAICLCLNAFAVFLGVGFSSGNGRFSYEATCSRLIMRSFRFCYTALLQIVWLSTLVRRATLKASSPLSPVSIFFCAILTLMFLLNDGVPALPASVQAVQSLFGFVVFSWFAVYVFLKVADPTQDIECFARVGSLELCVATVQFSVFSNLALVYGFMLILRLLSPGVSMFLNEAAT